MFQDTDFKYSNVQYACEIFFSEICIVLVDLRLFMIQIFYRQYGDSYSTFSGMIHSTNLFSFTRKRISA